jgi:hypothetical protein
LLPLLLPLLLLLLLLLAVAQALMPKTAPGAAWLPLLPVLPKPLPQPCSGGGGASAAPFRPCPNPSRQQGQHLAVTASLTALNPGAQPQEHNGKRWDFVFDVEMDEGNPRKLAVNRGENPYVAARRFLEQEELPPYFTEQVGLAGRPRCVAGGGVGLDSVPAGPHCAVHPMWRYWPAHRCGSMCVHAPPTPLPARSGCNVLWRCPLSQPKSWVGVRPVDPGLAWRTAQRRLARADGRELGKACAWLSCMSCANACGGC